VSRLVDDRHRLFVGVVAGDQPLRRVAQAVLVPRREREELLQRPRRHVRQVGDRLDALARQVAELPADVLLEVAARVGADEAVGVLVEVVGQCRPQRSDLLLGHP
jgi:hypothetical protein